MNLYSKFITFHAIKLQRVIKGMAIPFYEGQEPFKIGINTGLHAKKGDYYIRNQDGSEEIIGGKEFESGQFILLNKESFRGRK